jgi:hypothetical protein
MEYKLRLIILGTLFFCLCLAAVAPANSVIKELYIDGQLVGDVNVTTQMLKFAVPYLKIGAEGNNGWSYNEYTGDIDEFAVYKGVLSAEDVNAHYQAGITSDYNDYEVAIEADNPVLWLKFEDASVGNGDTALNSGSADINGVYTAIGAESLSQEAGICSGTKAVVFPDAQVDADGCFVLVNEPAGECSTALDDGAGGVDVSIELWAKFTDVNSLPENGYPRFFSHNGHWQTQGGYAGFVNNDPCQLGSVGGNVSNFFTYAAPVNDGQWHHYVFTYDSTYVPPEVGTYAAEVKKDHPVLYIRFEEYPFVDDSNNNYWVGSAPLVEFREQPQGAMGNAAWLGGGWIAAAPQATEPCSPPSFSDAYEWGPNDITIEFWAATPQPDLVDIYAELFTDVNTLLMGVDGGEASRYRPYAGLAVPQARMSLGDADGSDPQAYTTAETWKTNVRWHHHVLIWDERPDTNQIWIEWYRDTVSCKNGTYATTPATGWAKHGGPEMDHFLFGGYGSKDNFSPGVGVPYMQYVDELAIYDHVLPEARVEAHYDAFKPQTCEEIWERGIFTDIIPIENKAQGKIDRNKDCQITFYDFATFASDWAQCNEPGGGTGCSPNW